MAPGGGSPATVAANATMDFSGSNATYSAPANTFKFSNHMPLVGIIVSLSAVILLIITAWVAFTKHPWERRRPKSPASTPPKPELDGTGLEKNPGAGVQEMGHEEALHEAGGETWCSELDGTSCRSELGGDYHELEGDHPDEKYVTLPCKTYAISSEKSLPMIPEHPDTSHSQPRRSRPYSREWTSFLWEDP